MKIQIHKRDIKHSTTQNIQFIGLWHCLEVLSENQWYGQEWERDMLTCNKGYEDFAWQNIILTGGDKEIKEDDQIQRNIVGLQPMKAEINNYNNDVIKLTNSKFSKVVDKCHRI